MVIYVEESRTLSAVQNILIDPRWDFTAAQVVPEGLYNWKVNDNTVL